MLPLLHFLQLLSCSDDSTPRQTEFTDKQPPSVVIIGGGASGMATAIRLIEHGIFPTIIEKENNLGGAGIHAGRFFAIETNQQKESNIQDSLEITLEEWQTITGSDPDNNVENFLANSAVTLQWIESYGVEFESPVIDAGAGTLARLHPLSPNFEHPLTIWSTLLYPYALLNTSVLSIVQSDQTFTITTEDDIIHATHVVIASGGFARNADLVTNFLPEINDFDWHMEAWPGMTGDAFQWFADTNVELQNTNHIGLYAHSVSDPLLGSPETMIIPALERSLIVSDDGIRIMDETKTQSLQSGIEMLNHGPLFAIFDADAWPGTHFQGMGYNYDPPRLLSSSDFEDLGIMYTGSDVQDLANNLEIPSTNLFHTIEIYNQGFSSNTDEYGKDLSNLTAIQRPPFVAIPLVLSTGKSFGGAATSTLAESNIQNLYVVGEASGFLGTPSVGWGFSGSITACYHQGFQAADAIYATLSE